MLSRPPIPSTSALRALRHTLNPQASHLPTTQVRHATLLKRPKRPYTFTQLITLSDGSAFTVRTTNPQAVYKSAKDIRNAALWNPSSQKLLNVEEDEAGKLAAFRAKFGRGWDSEGDKGKTDHFMDLISGTTNKGKAAEQAKGKQVKPPPKVAEKKK